MKRLLNKACVITGGAGGIGFASVRRYLAEGAKVVLADLNEQAGREKLAQLAAEGWADRVRFCRCDISDEAEVVRMIQFTEEEFGGIDSIFNNAGVGGAYGPITYTRVSDWDRTTEIVLRGTFLCIKHAARAMIRQDRGGSIVNNVSVVARVGDAAGAAYAAAKAGVLTLTAYAAVQLAPHGIRVNSVSPGTIITPLLHRGKDADDLCRAAIEHQPWPEVDTGEHVAAVAAFLASDDAGLITSEDVFADGGAGAAGPGYCSVTGAAREELAPYLQAAGEPLLEY